MRKKTHIAAALMLIGPISMVNTAAAHPMHGEAAPVGSVAPGMHFAAPYDHHHHRHHFWQSRADNVAVPARAYPAAPVASGPVVRGSIMFSPGTTFAPWTSGGPGQ